MALNLATILEMSAERFPHNTAIILNDFRLDYTSLRAQVLRFAAGLSQSGVTPGDKVALLIPNLPQFTIAYFGTLYLGATVVPLNVLCVADEIKYHLDDSGAAVLVAFEGFLDAAAEAFRRSESTRLMVVVRTGPSATVLPEKSRWFDEMLAGAAPFFEMVQTRSDDTAVILYTSGTTGRPKGAELTHCNLYLNAQFANDIGGTLIQPRPITAPHVLMCCLPLFHSFGQTIIQNAGLFRGAAITLLPRFTPEDCFRVLERDKVTVFAGVPTMYFAMLHSPAANNFTLHLKYCISGGASIPLEVVNAFNARFNVQIQEGYGLSETSPAASFNTYDFPMKPGSIGMPIFGVQMKIVDDQGQEVPRGERGEVVIRGYNLMKGYYNRPEATQEAIRNGWFHSGDIGIQDEEGYFFIVDRKKDMIIRGGFNVYPREVEEVLYAHPAVMEAAVIGVPDPEYGEEIKAVVALKPGVQVSPEELTAYCRTHLAAYKYPRIFEFRVSLPKGPTGKILKREMRQAV